MAERRVWVAIPCYNEGAVVADTVRSVRAHFPDVVVVDDASSDQSGAAAAAAGAHVVTHPFNMGQGAALATGIAYALREGATHIATFDADGQHDIGDVQRMLDLLAAEDLDVVLGSRFLGSSVNMPSSRKAFLRAAVVFTRLTSGLPVTDAHNGLRVLRAPFARALTIRQNRMAHASEILTRIAELKGRWRECPVTIHYTDYSLAKGQKLSNSLNILLELLARRIHQ